MYSNIDLSDFFKNLAFKYFETYSLQRGTAYEKIFKDKEIRFNHLLKKSTKEILTIVDSKELDFLDSQLNRVQFLINKNKEKHYSAERIKKSNSTAEIIELHKILSIKTQKTPSWMCTPIYRDAIVFYNDKSEVVDILNICFSCEFMQNLNQEFIDADESVYESLKILLMKFGHKINSDK
ncbi:hypothetical protein NZ698_10800 [Chryseobacterium sp. PBS4-4]|uniref:Uncharacterized protein n=1 Tax=Chryseobacterium edaphi TaxID=2976532 RepID=A0ABT2W8V4_9FLAO|nr:hypothetical protein [Chryseobacterium edaphi]MCU7617687.1 hypothetical protein [Chryseobacterium edaphi]